MADGSIKALPAFDAAGQGRRLAMFRPALHGPNAGAASAGTILARCRHAVRNDPWAGTAIERSVSNGIGTGIQAKPAWGDKEFRAAVRKLWNHSVKVMDADGVVDLYGLQALAWREWKEAGEVFIRIRSRLPEDGLPVPMQVQLIESEQCPRDFTRTASNGNAIRQGIEFDRIGRRVAYWLHPAHPGDAVNTFATNEPVRVPADQIAHLFRPERAGMIRGTPSLASVLVKIFNFGTLDDAVLERQKIANLFSLFYVRKVGSDPDDVVGTDGGTAVDSDGTPLAGLEPGTGQELPDGVDVKFSNPPAPGDTYADFVRSGLQSIAARLGIPYEILTGDLREISDRALRLILNEFRRLIEMDQWLYMIPQMLERIRGAWFDAAVLSGKLAVPGYADMREDVVQTTWVAQGWPYSHPVQDVDSDIKAIRAGLASRSGKVMGLGEDAENTEDETVEDNARADAKGLSFDSDGRRPRDGKQATPAPTPDADDEQESK